MKCILITFFLQLFSYIGLAQQIRVTGIITYSRDPYYNAMNNIDIHASGSFADLGAEVFLISKDSLPNIDYFEIVDTLSRITSLNENNEIVKIYSRKKSSDFQKELIKYGIVTRDDYQNYRDRIHAILFAAEQKKISSTHVDGTGKYSLMLSELGRYFVLIKSNAKANHYFCMPVIAVDKDIDVSTEF